MYSQETAFRLLSSSFKVLWSINASPGFDICIERETGPLRPIMRLSHHGMTLLSPEHHNRGSDLPHCKTGTINSANINTPQGVLQGHVVALGSFFQT